MSPPFSAVTRPVGRAWRRVLLHRRPLSALAAGLAVLLALHAAAAPPPRTVPVWTAARDLAAGTVIAGEDLERTGFAPGSVPDDVVTDPRHVLGRALASPLARGEPLTGRRLLAPGLMAGYAGRTAVPLRITDGDVVALLRVGDRVSLVVADPDGRQPPHDLVDDVPLVAIPPQREASTPGASSGRLVVVAVPPDRAAEVAAGATAGILIPVWNR